MSYSYLLTLLGLALVAVGLTRGGWLLPAVWLGCDFVALGLAHATGSHRVFGKRRDGTLPFWSRLVFFPLLVCTTAVYHLLRWSSREPAKSPVTKDIVLGRRLLARELDEEFVNFVDLTAEFTEPSAIRRSAAYICFPILDGGAPKPEALKAVIDGLRPGRTFIHCAQGHGRGGLFALALLLKSGAARDVDEGLRILKAARPGVTLSRAQRACITVFEAMRRCRPVAPAPSEGPGPFPRP